MSFAEERRAASSSRERGGGWVDGWVNGWMDGWMDGWIDGWIAWLASRERRKLKDEERMVEDGRRKMGRRWRRWKYLL
ncbi:hypothetical protein K0M31_000636 [Melipona bicolor]|uniref:Uncharacterized protein n=1 Tax=Melipona bicolor TaxID=60889 RepID=A0AA40KX83_9HYME|nr:hypothetical protein K0M31_000636 [Melipona bicolor]